MSIEELPDSGSGHHPDGWPWTTTVLTLSAGVVLGVLMMWSIGPQAVPIPSTSPTASTGVARASLAPARPPAPLASAIPHPSPRPSNLVATGVPISARQSLSVDGVSFSFSVPTDGWARYGGLYISKSTHGPQGAEAMIFWARHAVGRYARVCGTSPSAPIGYTAAQVADDLASGLPGTELVAGPTDVTVGGLAATQVVLFVRDTSWCGPGFFYTWDGEEDRGGPLWGGSLLGDTITIWVLEMDGKRFIIAAETHLNAGAELEAEVQQIVDSIEFETPETNWGPGDYRTGRHTTTVDSTTFSFAIATSDSEPYPADGGPLGSILISKSTGGSQEAEEVIYWAGYGPSIDHGPCGVLQNRARPSSDLVVAIQVASAPGTNLVTGPEQLTVGGHPAVHVVVTVREAAGCDPGFFYGWTPQRGGAMWTKTRVGDTIRVWVVEVDAGLFFIGAATTPGAAGHEAEIQQIIDSIQFE
jgi:hypothetical protein